MSARERRVGPVSFVQFIDSSRTGFDAKDFPRALGLIRGVMRTSGVVLIPSGDGPIAGIQRRTREGGTFVPRRKVADPAEVLAVVPQAELAEAANRDRETLHQLEAHERFRQERYPSVTVNGVTYRHPEIGEHMQQEGPDSKKLRGAKRFLDGAGAFHLTFFDDIPLTVSGETVEISVMRATDTTVHGDMDSQFWIRDMARAGESEYDIWRLNPGANAEAGEKAHKLLVSSMHLMSTDAQLARFRNMIANPDLKKDVNQWPQIVMRSDKLDSSEPTEWRHAQDAFQILGTNLIRAFETFQDPQDPSIERRLIDPASLKQGNKEFLTVLPAFFDAVDFTSVPNSGTWEESPAPKSSVLGVEVALLDRMQQQAFNPELAFLRGGSDPEMHYQMLDDMINRGLHRLGERLPYESPEAGRQSFEYRSADAALVYLLEYGIPQMMEARQIPVKANNGEPMTAVQIEDMILGELRKLHDPLTHGMRRYGAEGDIQWDSYLGEDFNTDKTMLLVNGVKKVVKQEANGGAVDYGRKARLRQEIVPDGPQAAWLHPNAQVSSWAAKRYFDTKDKRYLDIAVEFASYTLAGVTGPADFHTLWDGEKHVEKKAKGARLTEGWKYRRASDRFRHETGGQTHLILPSPHSPLKWAEEEGKRALTLTIAAAEDYEKSTASAQGVYELFQRDA